jgi:hypothetical protein
VKNCIINRISTDRPRTISVAGYTSSCTAIGHSTAAGLRFRRRICALLELLEAEGHDVMELREELAHLLRALMRARHSAVKLESRRGLR